MKNFSLLRRRDFSRLLPKPGYGAALAVLASAVTYVSLASARVDGSGKVTTDNRQVSKVSAVELRGFGDLDIVQGDTESLSLTGEDNILPLITTEVDSKGTLHIGVKKGESVTTHEKLKYSLSVKSLNGLVLSGSGNIHVKELKNSGTFDVSLEGSGNVKLERIEANALKVSLAGSGGVTVAGEAPEQTVDIAGSGDYEAAKLKSKTAKLSVAGSGDVEIWATDTLDVSVDGSGDVEYKGKPTVKKQVHGSGSVEPMAEKAD